MDLDGDGERDILSGSWPGQLYFFQRKKDGSFAKQPRLLDDKDGKELNAGSASTVFAVDWDTDGDLDLLVGDIAGTVHLVRNESGGAKLSFGKPIELLTLKDVGDAQPVAADWDGDGLLDLLVAHSEGGVVWCRNVGSRDAPKLTKPRELLPNSPAPWQSDNVLRPTDWGVRAKICVVDWNGDGRLDLLLGDYCGGFSSKPEQTPAELAKERDALQRMPKLRSDWAATFAQYRELLIESKSKPELVPNLEPLRDRLVELKTEISRCQSVQTEFQPQRQTHGYVWLFLRKSSARSGER